MRAASISLHSKDAPCWSVPRPAEVGGPDQRLGPSQSALFASQRTRSAQAPTVPQRKPVGQQRLEEIPLPAPCLAVKNSDIRRRGHGGGPQRVSTGREISVPAPLCSSACLPRPCPLLCDHRKGVPVELGTGFAPRAPIRASRRPAAEHPEVEPWSAVPRDAPWVVVSGAACA